MPELVSRKSVIRRQYASNDRVNNEQHFCAGYKVLRTRNRLHVSISGLKPRLKCRDMLSVSSAPIREQRIFWNYRSRFWHPVINLNVLGLVRIIMIYAVYILERFSKLQSVKLVQYSQNETSIVIVIVRIRSFSTMKNLSGTKFKI